MNQAEKDFIVKAIKAAVSEDFKVVEVELLSDTLVVDLDNGRTIRIDMESYDNLGGLI